jgi:ABC-type glycerol-3-phosphate transport system substrate-binding protein
LLRTAQQLTENTTDKPVYGFADTSPEKTLSLFLDYFDASLVEDNGTSSHLNSTNSKVVQAIEYYIELLRTASPHQQIPGYTRHSQDNSVHQLIANGQVGMWFGTGLPDASTQSNLTVAVAPPPLNITPVAFKEVLSIGLHISAHTQYPAACWRWIKYLSMDTSGLGMAFPARRSLVLADDFTARAPLGSAEVYTAYGEHLMQPKPIAENTNNAPPVGELPIDYFWFYRAVDRALQGADLERELTEAQSLSEAYLACVQGGTSGRTCAIQVDPDYAGRQ